MEALKREMARKCKALEQARQQADGGFVKAGELRRVEDEQRYAGRVGGEQKLVVGEADIQNINTMTRATNPQEPQVASSSSSKRLKSTHVSSSCPCTAISNKELALTGSGSESEPNPVSSAKQSKNSRKDGGSDHTKPSSSLSLSSSSTPQKQPQLQLSSLEITKQLRLLGLPIRFFGEVDDRHRQTRLETALEGRAQTLLGKSERQEFLLEKGYRIRNPFLEKEEEHVARAASGGDKKKQPGSNSKQAPVEATSKMKDKSEDKKTSEKKEGKDRGNQDRKKDEGKEEEEDHIVVLKYFKGLLNEWEEVLANRPDHVKQTVAGKNETKTARQCRDYIQPLFRACQKRQLDLSMLAHLRKIVRFCQEGEFVKAHDAYMDVAIGRAAWPIGVTMVGIHARTGRSKIESHNVAHVMNSELQRKYLTSIKRLLTFCQKQRTDVDPSKKVL